MTPDMKRSNFIVVLVLVLVAAGAGMSSASSVNDSNDIKQLMQRRDAEIKTLMGPKGTKHTQEQTEKLKSIINDMVDFEAMAKMALQDTWTEATTAQQQEFVDLFSKIIRDQSLAKPDIYRASVTYEDVTVNGNTAMVKTIAVFENVRTPVSYAMSKKGNKWFITDIIIDNVSTAASYQKSFQNTIRKRGFATLLDALRKRADKV
jgi:phospholipid transport system substrate-binding protein